MRGQQAQTGHIVCKYMQLEHEHVEAVERYWSVNQRRCEMHVAHARFFCFVRAAGDAA